MSSVSVSRSWLTDSLKVGLYSLVFCTFFVLLFALAIKLFSIPHSVIPIVNQAIKVVSVVISSLLYVRGERGFLKGALGGLFFCLLSTALFALLGGKFSFSNILIDLAIAVAVGGVVGAIAANKRR